MDTATRVSSDRRSTRSRRPRSLLIGVAVGVASAAVLAGCSSHPAAKGTTTTVRAPRTTTTTRPASTSTTASTTTTTTAAPASTTTTTTTAASTTTSTTSTIPAGFTAAKQEWVNGASASSADQNSYFSQAATDLSAAASSGAPGTSSYAAAVSELQNLETIPETSATAAQQAEAKQDIDELNTFFGTSGLYD